ncbi:MAG: UvrB/UvrC motif-containing protein [Oscillospiraceae bacterium]|jgi:protein arginine kinase activator|nr:UvrB/UvrC motif-containing protein [Oscillospiraceae bacterium]
MKFNKCENCGKNEISFHFKSNVNGVVTERHLCSECAAKLGYAGMGAAGLPGMLGGIFNDFFGTERGMQPQGGFGMMIPAFVVPGLEVKGSVPVWQPRPEMDDPGVAPPQTSLDGDLREKLEINKMRARMQKAASDEDFETAARLRDKIREMESAYALRKRGDGGNEI